MLIFFQGVLQALRAGMKPPRELQLCVTRSSGHNMGRKKKYPSEKNTRCVQYFHFFVGLPCVAVGPAVTFHMPGIGMVCLVPDAIGVPRVSCHSQLVWKIQGAGCFFFKKISFSV